MGWQDRRISFSSLRLRYYVYPCRTYEPFSLPQTNHILIYCLLTTRSGLGFYLEQPRTDPILIYVPHPTQHKTSLNILFLSHSLLVHIYMLWRYRDTIYQMCLNSRSKPLKPLTHKVKKVYSLSEPSLRRPNPLGDC